MGLVVFLPFVFLFCTHMHLRMLTCIYSIQAHTLTHSSKHICTYTHVCACTHTRTNTHTHTHTHILSLSLSLSHLHTQRCAHSLILEFIDCCKYSLMFTSVIIAWYFPGAVCVVGGRLDLPKHAAEPDASCEGSGDSRWPERWGSTTVPSLSPSLAVCCVASRRTCFSAVAVVVGWLMSQQHASMSQGWVCSDNCMCCHTEIEVADQTFSLSQSQYTDTGPGSPSADPITPGVWQVSHWSANF